jgi:hypothetical protein
MQVPPILALKSILPLLYKYANTQILICFPLGCPLCSDSGDSNLVRYRNSIETIKIFNNFFWPE